MAGHLELDLNAPRRRVTAALTTLRGLRGWWSPLAVGRASAGGDIHLHFAEVAVDRAAEVIMRVEMAGRRTVRWQCRHHSEAPAWVGSRVVFTVSVTGRSSRLAFRHIGADAAGRRWDDGRADTSWSRFLASLGGFAETGRGDPWEGRPSEIPPKYLSAVPEPHDEEYS